MKTFKLFIVALVIANFYAATLSAQKEIPDSSEVLFDSNGSFTRVIATKEEVNAKMITVNPIIDDVTWRKVVIRVVDLREQQNRPLYYPHENLEPESQKNLFSIIFANFLEGNLKCYSDPAVTDRGQVPRFVPKYEIKPKEWFDAEVAVALGLEGDDSGDDYMDEGYDEYADEQTEDDGYSEDMGMDMPTTYDLINNVTPGVIQYYIQEIWYFNKTASTFENKIIAIAPIVDEKYILGSSMIASSGLLFWIPYEKLRPLLQEEYVKTSGRNLSPLTNFDDFFVSRMFYSYIFKDYALENRAIDYLIEDNPTEIRKEQQKVEDEIINFEQDLWNY